MLLQTTKNDVKRQQQKHHNAQQYKFRTRGVATHIYSQVIAGALKKQGMAVPVEEKRNTKGAGPGAGTQVLCF